MPAANPGVAPRRERHVLFCGLPPIAMEGVASRRLGIVGDDLAAQATHVAVGVFEATRAIDDARHALLQVLVPHAEGACLYAGLSDC